MLLCWWKGGYTSRKGNPDFKETPQEPLVETLASLGFLIWTGPPILPLCLLCLLWISPCGCRFKGSFLWSDVFLSPVRNWGFPFHLLSVSFIEGGLTGRQKGALLNRTSHVLFAASASGFDQGKAPDCMVDSLRTASMPTSHHGNLAGCCFPCET